MDKRNFLGKLGGVALIALAVSQSSFATVKTGVSLGFSPEDINARMAKAVQSSLTLKSASLTIVSEQDRTLSQRLKAIAEAKKNAKKKGMNPGEMALLGLGGTVGVPAFAGMYVVAQIITVATGSANGATAFYVKFPKEGDRGGSYYAYLNCDYGYSHMKKTASVGPCHTNEYHNKALNQGEAPRWPRSVRVNNEYSSPLWSTVRFGTHHTQIFYGRLEDLP